MKTTTLNLYLKACPILKEVKEGEAVYFVHSYYAGAEKKNVAASVDYGVQVPAVVWNGKNIFGTQFHPEKSGEAGLGMLRNFCKLK